MAIASCHLLTSMDSYSDNWVLAIHRVFLLAISLPSARSRISSKRRELILEMRKDAMFGYPPDDILACHTHRCGNQTAANPSESAPASVLLSPGTAPNAPPQSAQAPTHNIASSASIPIGQPTGAVSYPSPILLILHFAIQLRKCLQCKHCNPVMSAML